MSVKALLPLALALASCAPALPLPRSLQPTRAARHWRRRVPAARAGPTPPTRAHLWQHLLCRHLRDQRDPDHVGQRPYSDRHCARQSRAVCLANIRTLGFDPKDVKFLLTSHEHIDHVGGIAAIKAATGPDRACRRRFRGLRPARWAARIRNMTSLCPLTGPKVDRVIKDGEVLRLGPIAITASPRPATPWAGPAGVGRAAKARNASPSSLPTASARCQRTITGSAIIPP